VKHCANVEKLSAQKIQSCRVAVIEAMYFNSLPIKNHTKMFATDIRLNTKWHTINCKMTR